MPAQIGVTATQASFGASAADGRGFTVTVDARGAKGNPRMTSMVTETLGTAETTVTGTAPDINGRSAKWLADGLEWEYANGGWATLLAGGETKAQAQQGWGGYCTADIPKGTKSPIADPKTTCAPYTQLAQFRAALEKVASNLTWTPQPFAFPFRFTHTLPSGWTVSEVTGEFVNGRLTSVQTNLVPKGAPNTKDPLIIQAFSAGNTANCAGFAFFRHHVHFLQRRDLGDPGRSRGGDCVRGSPHDQEEHRLRGNRIRARHDRVPAYPARPVRRQGHSAHVPVLGDEPRGLDDQPAGQVGATPDNAAAERMLESSLPPPLLWAGLAQPTRGAVL